MKRVEFERTTSTLTGYGFKGVKTGFYDVEEIIAERIKNGWDFQGFVPIITRGTGDIEEMSLVFVKEDEE